MGNKIRHGRAGQKLRLENATHGLMCDSKRGAALGRARAKKMLHRRARRGLRLTVGRGHFSPGAQLSCYPNGREEWNTPNPAHQHFGRNYVTACGIARPWKREMEDEDDCNEAAQDSGANLEPL